MRHTQEVDLGGGATVIIEWSSRWNCYAGTVQKDGWHQKTILRDTPEEIVEVAKERRG